jgi:prepilin-type N-terminal cleavage/methylation domain-containing protein
MTAFTRNRSKLLRSRRGLSLTELLVASAIMVLIAGGLASLATTVHSANDFSRGRIISAQHARVVLDRIHYTIDHATASEYFPVCLVVSEQVGSEDLPQTLVVWSPTTTAANPSGLPLVCELAIYAPDPAQPANLVEFRAATNANAVPAATDTASWRTLVESLKTSQTTDKIVLTEHLRTAPLSGQWNSSLTASQLRGVVRFHRLIAPTEQQWAEYKAGTRAWNALSWPLDSYRTTSGTRAVACQTELQIVAGNMASATSTAVPFFGSVVRTYELAH